MNILTPQKISTSDSSCFICSSSADSKKRIRIFKGTSSLDIRSLIEETLGIDLSIYVNSDSFICVKCYKTLVKFQKAVIHVNDIKNGLQKLYEEHSHGRRVKRLARNEDLESRKKLAFEHQPTESTACKSSTCAFAVEFSLPTFQQFSGACSNNALASTPIKPASAKSCKQENIEEPSATITVEYPSKTVKKKLSSDLQPLGKALAHGPASRIAKAIFKSKTLRAEVIAQVLRVVTKEVSDLCSIKNPSLLRKTSKEDLVNFELNKICDEWKQRAPVFYSFLLTCCSTKMSQEPMPSVAVSGSILLKQRNNHMNATASVLGILIKTGSMEVNIKTYLLIPI